ncbi:MAG: hypothetical protein IV100_22480 [Myxococcales bacterium]|nr:hypothetical protein [Myxococcales bacterium]
MRRLALALSLALGCSAGPDTDSTATVIAADVQPGTTDTRGDTDDDTASPDDTLVDVTPSQDADPPADDVDVADPPDVGFIDGDDVSDIDDGVSPSDIADSETTSPLDDVAEDTFDDALEDSLDTPTDVGVAPDVDPATYSSCPGFVGVLNPGASVSGNTLDAKPNDADCLGKGGAYVGAASRDETWVLIAPPGVYTLTLTATFDSLLYARASCGGTCLGVSDVVGDGVTETLAVAVSPGEVAFVVVDGFGSASAAGTYTLEVSEVCQPECGGKACGPDGCGLTCGTCGDPAAGVAGYCHEGACVSFDDTCAPMAPVHCDQSVGPLTSTMPGATTAFSTYTCQQFSFESYFAGPELTYTFDSKADQVVTITGDGTYPLDVFVLEDQGAGCADGLGACQGGLGDVYTFEARAGRRYYVVWDSASPSTPVVDAFSFDLDCCKPVCAPGACGMPDGCGKTCSCADSEKCGAEGQCEPLGLGELCETPFVIPLAVLLPTSVTGDTTIGKDGRAIPKLTCGFYFAKGEGSNDHVYHFVPPETAVYTLAVEATHPTAVYVGTDCDAIAATCLAGGYGEAGAEVVVPLDAGVPVDIVVDGAEAGAAGPYTLHISAPCQPNCPTCGVEDGCGGICGCPPGELCNPEGQCGPLPEP